MIVGSVENGESFFAVIQGAVDKFEPYPNLPTDTALSTILAGCMQPTCGACPSVSFRGSLIIQRLMKPPMIIKLHVLLDILPRFVDRAGRLQINFFLLERSPEPLDVNVVHAASFPVHADLNPVGFQPVNPLRTGKLAPLITVENLRLGMGQRGIQHGYTKFRFQRNRQFPGNDVPAIQVDQSHQIQKAPSHRDIRDVRGPDLIRPGDFQPG